MTARIRGFRDGLRAVGPFTDDADYLRGWEAGLRLGFACEGLTCGPIHVRGWLR